MVPLVYVSLRGELSDVLYPEEEMSKGSSDDCRPESSNKGRWPKGDVGEGRGDNWLSCPNGEAGPRLAPYSPRGDMSIGESARPFVWVKMGATILEPFLDAMRSNGVSGVAESEPYESAPARLSLRNEPLG